MGEKITEKRWERSLQEKRAEAWRKTERLPDPQSCSGNGSSKSNKVLFSIDTPPPYVNKPVHMGHAVTYTLMDMFARFHRMMGKEVLFPLGLDRNGLPIEMEAEKKFGKRFDEVSREEYLEMCRSVLEASSDATKETFAKLGISFSSFEDGDAIGKVYYTDSESYRILTQSTFIDLWNKGLIYEGELTTNYCPGCKTTIADSEIEYHEKNALFTNVRWNVKETGETIVIGTTRPELLCSCAAVLFHPDDERYKHLEGKRAVVPVYGKEVPLMAHPFAQIDKGTGLVMMCSFGDQTDIQFFRENNLKPLLSIGIDGKMNSNAGVLEGLKVKEARKKILELLKEKDLVDDQKQILHRSPLCERSKDHIEFIAMKEWYLKQVEFKKKMLEYAKNLNFYAEQNRQILLDWIETVSIDWPISRRRYYATEIPMWYCEACNKPYVPPKGTGTYFQPWRQAPPIESCPSCGHSAGDKTFRGETRVFDTWFDSSISPLYILGYERHDEFFKNNQVCSLRPQGKEIVRTWLYYTLLKCHHLTDRKIFDDVWVHYHVTDEKGKKMSKSLGNIIDPQDIVKKFGAEPFRLWCAVEGNITTTDLRCSYDRIEGAGKTLTKLWNVARFISSFEKTEGKAQLREIDHWIRDQLNEEIERAKQSYQTYDFNQPGTSIKHFLWETFASHYIELVKKRAYNEENKFSEEEQRGAIETLYEVLRGLLKLLAPIVPFITADIYELLWEKDIHGEPFPEVENHRASTENIRPAQQNSTPALQASAQVTLSKQDVTETNSAIWKAKKDAGLSLKAELDNFHLPAHLKPIEKDLLITHNLKNITWE